MIGAELEATVHLLRGAADLVHYVYGEEHAWYGPRIAGRRTRPFILSYHQPPAYLERLLPATTWRRLLCGARFVTVVSRSQADFFSQFVDGDRIRFVAHGVDTKYFSPPPARHEHPVRTCLTVGRWLRDFEQLRSVQRILWRRLGPRVRFVVITSEQEAAGPWPDGVTALTGLADELMLHHYRSADVLCLPLTDGTANNVVLEAMACALPVVVTATEGLRDYVDASCARLIQPGHAEAMADAVVDVLEGGGATLGCAARGRALRFDWSVVRQSLVDVYREALGDRAR